MLVNKLTPKSTPILPRFVDAGIIARPYPFPIELTDRCSIRRDSICPFASECNAPSKTIGTSAVLPRNARYFHPAFLQKHLPQQLLSLPFWITRLGADRDVASFRPFHPCPVHGPGTCRTTSSPSSHEGRQSLSGISLPCSSPLSASGHGRGEQFLQYETMCNGKWAGTKRIADGGLRGFSVHGAVSSGQKPS